MSRFRSVSEQAAIEVAREDNPDTEIADAITYDARKVEENEEIQTAWGPAMVMVGNYVFEYPDPGNPSSVTRFGVNADEAEEGSVWEQL